MKYRIITILLAVLTLAVVTSNAQNPKREFRGAWIQCVNGQYLGKTPLQIREMLSSQLDVLKRDGINAIMFQVRAEGDALYRSSYEPWSRYLTGRQGTAPADGWDPLAWMIDQCHQREMELHAWINPYRAKTKGTTEVATSHIAYRNPERLFMYGDLLIFNPALEVNRIYTCMIIEDIINKYDVDGIHMDDYFYPYPVQGLVIPDAEYYRNNSRGFDDIDDWRRDNVNMLIRDIHSLISTSKPWVKFGISPFGIYRNNIENTNSPRGSATKGLQNYDQLYADIVLWANKGWIDYTIPQIYWNIGTPAADYDILCHWWNDYCNNRPIFIGQDVERTVKGPDPQNPQQHQMDIKYRIQRSLPNVQGSCQWYAAAVVNNPGNYGTMLESKYHATPALQPLMPFIDSKAPSNPKNVSVEAIGGKVALVWCAPKDNTKAEKAAKQGKIDKKKEMQKAIQYVVYRFAPGEKVDLSNAANIATITHETHYFLKGNVNGYTFVITSLDRMHNESKGVKIKL